MNRCLKAEGITESLWYALLFVYVSPNREIMPSHLSDLLNLTRTSATRLADENVRARLVRRERGGTTATAAKSSCASPPKAKPSSAKSSPSSPPNATASGPASPTPTTPNCNTSSAACSKNSKTEPPRRNRNKKADLKNRFSDGLCRLPFMQGVRRKPRTRFRVRRSLGALGNGSNVGRASARQNSG